MPTRPFPPRTLALVPALLGGLAAVPGPAHAYPASYFSTRQTAVDVPACVATARKALVAAGVPTPPSAPGASAIGGTTPSTRAYVVCVRLPKDGACGGDGSTAVMVTAGDDASSLVKAVAAAFKPPTVIDCGIGRNPVQEP